MLHLPAHCGLDCVPAGVGARLQRGTASGRRFRRVDGCERGWPHGVLRLGFRQRLGWRYGHLRRVGLVVVALVVDVVSLRPPVSRAWPKKRLSVVHVLERRRHCAGLRVFVPYVLHLPSGRPERGIMDGRRLRERSHQKRCEVGRDGRERERPRCRVLCRARRRLVADPRIPPPVVGLNVMDAGGGAVAHSVVAARLLRPRLPIQSERDSSARQCATAAVRVSVVRALGRGLRPPSLDWAVGAGRQHRGTHWRELCKHQLRVLCGAVRRRVAGSRGCAGGRDRI